MSDEVKAFYEKFKQDMGKMQQQVGPTVKGFMGLFETTMKEGKLTTKEKECIALGIAVAVQCGPCIKLHVQKAVAAGATREEIMEVASVSVMMGGGPAFTHIPEVMDALDALGK